MNNNINPEEKSSSALKIFNYVGAALIFFGVAYFIGSNWNKISDFFKVFVSLGTAIVAYIVAMLFQSANKYTASTAFYLLAGLLLPIGLFITYKVYHIPLPNRSVDLVIASLCFIVFLLSQLQSSRIVFQIFSIIYGTYFYLSVIEFILYGKSVSILNLNEYELIALGLSYIFLGYYFYLYSSSILTAPLYLIGASLVLGSAYFLGSSQDLRFIFHWRIPAIIGIILAFILAVPLKAKSFLLVGSIFTIIYVIDMSSRFADVFGDNGWALILVLSGLLLILMGYLVFMLNKKICNRSRCS